MEYIPGDMHVSLHKVFYVDIGRSFTISLCKERYNDLKDISDWDNLETIDLNKGDILKLRYFKPHVDSHLYTYVDSIIRNGDLSDDIKFEDIKKESIISQGFLELNLSIFQKMDHRIFEREEKINQILKP
jgi:hypothetical protein